MVAPSFAWSRARTFVLFAALLFASACTGVQRPGSDEFVSTPLAVKSPFFNEHSGALHLLNNGQWVFFPTHPDHAIDLQPGGLLAYGDSEDTFRHLFRVSQTAPWGLILTRLDSDPIATRAQASLIGLGVTDAAQMQRWNFCAGSSHAPSESCINQYPTGTTFRVFAQGVPNDVFADAQFRVGDPESTLGELPADWIAVPLGHTPPRSESRVLQQGCTIDHPRLGIVSSEFTIPQTPLEVENTSFEFGVDAIFRCDGETITVWTPGILRARIPSPRERMVTTTIASARPTQGKLPEKHHPILAAAFAALGAGDFHAASFYGSQLARIKGNGLDDVLRVLSEVSAGIGELEAGLQMATRGSGQMWNPETDVAWNITRARVEDALGDGGRAQERWVALGERAKAQREDSLMGWLLWNEFRQRHQKGTERYQDILMSASGPLSQWRTAILVWLALVEDADSLSAITPAQRAPARQLIDSKSGTHPTRLRSSASHILDVYGYVSAQASGVQLARMGYSQYLPGLKYELSSDLLKVAALTRFFPEARQNIAPLLLAEMEKGCPDRWLAQQAEAQSHTPQNENIWTITHLLNIACRSLDELLEADVPESNADAYAQILDTILLKRPDTDVLHKVSGLENIPAQTCQRWRLASAANRIVTGELGLAIASLKAAESCKSLVYADSAVGLSLFVDFERTARLRMVENADIRSRLARALGHEASGCVGAQPLTHDIRPILHPDLLAYVPETVVLGRGESADLVQASELLAEAAENLEILRQKIAKNELGTVPEELKVLESTFRRLGHQPGLARVRWLQSHFGEGPSRTPKKYEVLTHPEKASLRSEDNAWLVDYLARGEVALAQRRTTIGSSTLCSVAPMTTESIVVE